MGITANWNDAAIRDLVELRKKYLEEYPEMIEVISTAMGEAVYVIEKNYEIREDVTFDPDENNDEEYVENMEVVNISVDFYKAIGMDWEKVNT